jgi:hypothetical protein
MFATRVTQLYDGYAVYHNLSPRLPVNLAMARVVDVDPNTPGRRPLWRGDVIVVRRLIEQGPMIEQSHCDMPPNALELFNSKIIPELYNSPQWRNILCWEERLIPSGLIFLCILTLTHIIFLRSKASQITKKTHGMCYFIALGSRHNTIPQIN